ncbi:WD repeat-containing protein 54 [Liparis tanakae]|uniref:WD repeat-containing protein 54 n=1 Tax=Liparis tanakae TaxID=230148 RepID=A0A4Z2HMD1_9TELE|nr:WD repeat-containing protein 54 [Liparis tanakae]
MSLIGGEAVGANAFCSLPSRDLLVVTSQKGIQLWKGTVVAGYGTGQIRLYEAVTGILHAEVNAHARWIYSLDIAPYSGLLLSAAEDSLVRVWQLIMTPESQSVEIAHLHNECVTDTQICGAKFCDADGYAFAVTGYDLTHLPPPAICPAACRTRHSQPTQAFHNPGISGLPRQKSG